MKPFLFLVCGAMLLNAVDNGFGQGTAFLYQGQLAANGSPANGNYDLTFMLVNNLGGQAGNTLTNTATAVSNGLFSVALDFGPGVFNGSNLWLQIGVRSNGGGAFTPLSPMQSILPTPYAIMAGMADNLSGPLPAAQLSGAYPGNVTLDNVANIFAGVFSGDGSGLTNVDAASLNGLAGINYATLDVLTNYAPLSSLTNAPGSSPIPNMQVFDSPGTNQFTVPAGVTRIAIEVWGGGGGGGNAGSASTTAGGGGGAGGYGKGVFAVTPGSGYTVIVGAGGVPTASGSPSSFGALISAGGGASGTSSQSFGSGGVGGASTATINIMGGSGQWASSQGGSYGGSAGLGGSGGVGDSGFVVGAGQAPGGGGGGGWDQNDPGGSGAHGRVIVYY
jgi:hypothetical protein